MQISKTSNFTRNLLNIGQRSIPTLWATPNVLSEKLTNSLSKPSSALLAHHTLTPLIALTGAETSFQALAQWKPSGALRRQQDKGLKYCPCCRADDVNRYGSAAWRVAHQIPGVTCCHSHGCRLISSTVPCGTDELIALDEIPEPNEIQPATRGERLFADSAARWLQLAEEHPTLENVARAVALLQHGRHVAMRPKLLASTLAKDITQNLPDLVEELYGDRDAADSVRKDLFPRAPNHTFVVIAALAVSGLDLSVVLSTARNLSHKGGPYRCTNKFADCYNKATIPTFHITPALHAIFTCPTCGHKYSREYPLTEAPDANFEFRIIATGDFSGDRLAQLWQQPTQTWRSLSQQLGAPISVIGRRAALRGLTNMPGRSLDHYREWVTKKTEASKLADRTRLLELNRPNLTESERAERTALHRKLRRRDTDWYIATFPKRKCGGRKPHVDWDARYSSLVAAIPEARIRLLQKDAVARVSRRQLMGHLSISKSQLGMMPRLVKELDNAAETPAEFVRRMIKRAIANRGNTGFTSPIVLARAAHIISGYYTNSETRQQVQLAWNSLTPRSGQVE